jgi:hypothetical protein
MPDHLGRVLAAPHTYGELLETLRARRDELDISNAVIEEIAGLTDSHAGKILALNPTRFIGPVAFNLFEALGLKIVVVEDLAALERAMRNHNWRNRQQNQAVPVHHYPPAA